MEIPVILVRCEYEGASPSEIEIEIAKRIEDAVASIDGIKHVTSLCIEDDGPCVYGTPSSSKNR